MLEQFLEYGLSDGLSMGLLYTGFFMVAGGLVLYGLISGILRLFFSSPSNHIGGLYLPVRMRRIQVEAQDHKPKGVERGWVDFVSPKKIGLVYKVTETSSEFHLQDTLELEFLTKNKSLSRMRMLICIEHMKLAKDEWVDPRSWNSGETVTRQTTRPQGAKPRDNSKGKSLGANTERRLPSYRYLTCKVIEPSSDSAVRLRFPKVSNFLSGNRLIELIG